MANNYVIISIFNSGFSDLVMDAARKVGATGGTIIDARGTVNKEIEEKFGIAIHGDKEMALIVVDAAKKDPVLKAIYENVGLNQNAQCFTFCLIADEVAGFTKFQKDDKPKEK